MKLSTTTVMYHNRQDGSYVRMDECMKLLYEAGYRDLDLHFCKASVGEIELCEDNWEEWAHEFREKMEVLGMTASQSHAPFYGSGCIPEDPAKYEYAEEMIRRSIRAAGIIGARSITIHGNMLYGTPDISKIKAMNVEYFKRHLELAEQCGVSIAIENMFDKRKDFTRVRRYLADTNELLDLVDTLGKDFGNVGVCWDFGHANETSTNQPQALRMIGKRLIATHVNDNYGILDDHLLPYMGQVKWKPIMETLREIGYDGSFTYETHKFTISLPDELIPAALRYSVEVGNYLLSLAGGETYNYQGK